ncbi:MAG TPA: YicC/YloC family endoribonuclease [Dissulfurispiraceae bacterium]|nr:YicC/YloC family endoribonuclease [Dissulfurispiraceae bacterium]
MIQSMTGYGATEQEGYKVEIRSVNQKGLDIGVRMPSLLMQYEVEIRSRIREAFQRGKVDVMISLTEQRQPAVTVNRELAKSMHDAFGRLQQELSLPGQIGIEFFSGYRDLILQSEPSHDSEALFGALAAAIHRLRTMRETEGAAMAAELCRILDGFEADYMSLCSIADGVVARLREKMTVKVAELLGSTELDEARLAQEVALIAQRSDIAEEIARLRSHIDQLRNALSAGDSAIGRRLDFLLQEMHREVNTIGSKADEIGVISLTIEMKNAVGRLREQSLNIQ